MHYPGAQVVTVEAEADNVLIVLRWGVESALRYYSRGYNAGWCDG